MGKLVVLGFSLYNWVGVLIIVNTKWILLWIFMKKKKNHTLAPTQLKFWLGAPISSNNLPCVKQQQPKKN